MIPGYTESCHSDARPRDSPLIPASMYPQGASLTTALDMSRNVWVSCSTSTRRRSPPGWVAVPAGWRGAVAGSSISAAPAPPFGAGPIQAPTTAIWGFVFCVRSPSRQAVALASDYSTKPTTLTGGETCKAALQAAHVGNVCIAGAEPPIRYMETSQTGCRREPTGIAAMLPVSMA